MTSTLALPITQDALRLLAAEAKANGVTIEQQAVRLLEAGFGVTAGHVLECVLADARHSLEAAAAQPMPAKKAA